MEVIPSLEEAIDRLRRTGEYRRAHALAVRTVHELEAGDADPVRRAGALLELARTASDLGEQADAESAFLRARSVVLGVQGADAILAAASAELAGALLFRGRPTEARALIDHALSLAPSISPGDPALTTVLVEAARLRIDDGDEAGATELLDRGLAELERLPEGPRQDRARVAILEAIGESQLGRGLLAEADGTARAALTLAETRLGPGSLEVAHLLNELGMTCKYAARFDEAEQLYRRSLAILEQVAGGEHPDAASVYHNLGGLAHARGDFTAAEPWARRSVEVRQRSLGADHPVTMRDRAAYASILDGLGRHDEAEAIFREAIDILSESLGPDHPEVAVNLNNLAAVLAHQGDLDGAEAAYVRALEIKERRLGPRSPSLAITLNNLGTIRRRQGLYDDAEDDYRRALAILEQAVEPDHPTRRALIDNLAVLERARARRPST